MDAHQTHVLVETLGWTLIHFVWQGALVAGLLFLALAALGSRPARVRYLVRCAALGAMAFAPFVTFVWLWGEAPPLPSLGSGESLAALDAAELPTSNESIALAWVVGLWTLGAFLCMLRISGGLVQVARLRRRTQGVALSPRWQRRFDQLARDFGVRARARLVESARVCVPAVIGFARPIVLLPARLFSGLSDEQIEALLAHELAHIARNDYLVNIVQSVVESLLFYHPAVWWVSRGIRVEREYCCDDLAVAATHNGLAYAHALTAIESWRGAQPQLGVSTLGGSLMLRIQRLLGVTPTSTRKTLRPAHAIAGLFVASTLTASAFAVAALPEPALCDCKCACHRQVAKGQVGRHKVLLPEVKTNNAKNMELITLEDLFAKKKAAEQAQRHTTMRVRLEDVDGQRVEGRVLLDVPETGHSGIHVEGESGLHVERRLPTDGGRSLRGLMVQGRTDQPLTTRGHLVLRQRDGTNPEESVELRVLLRDLILEQAEHEGGTDTDLPERRFYVDTLEGQTGYLLEVHPEVDTQKGEVRLRTLLRNVERETDEHSDDLQRQYKVRVGNEIHDYTKDHSVYEAKRNALIQRKASADGTHRAHERTRTLYENKAGDLTTELLVQELHAAQTGMRSEESDLRETKAALEQEVEALKRRLDELQQQLDRRKDEANVESVEWNLRQSD